MPLLIAAILFFTVPAFADVANGPFFECARWDNVSVGNACFKTAYDVCGLDVALAEQKECVDGFNGLPTDQQQNPSIAAEYCVELLDDLTKAALCPKPLPYCNEIQFPQLCQSGRKR